MQETKEQVKQEVREAIVSARLCMKVAMEGLDRIDGAHIFYLRAIEIRRHILALLHDVIFIEDEPTEFVQTDLGDENGKAC